MYLLCIAVCGRQLPPFVEVFFLRQSFRANLFFFVLQTLKTSYVRKHAPLKEMCACFYTLFNYKVDLRTIYKKYSKVIPETPLKKKVSCSSFKVIGKVISSCGWKSAFVFTTKRSEKWHIWEDKTDVSDMLLPLLSKQTVQTNEVYAVTCRTTTSP